MKVLITSGGTTEQIDTVRSITNTSTGMLGSLIAEAFSKWPETEEIFYICGKTAILPQSERTAIIPVDNVASLESAIRFLLKVHHIDIVVHGMAVSDYRVKSITTASKLAGYLASQQNLMQSSGIQVTDTLIRSSIEKSGAIKGSSGKISSGLDDMILLMEPTPKIISLFKELSPDSVLVGFKLLHNAGLPALIDTAYSLLRENKCSFVLANDLSDISHNRHIGYLISGDKSFERYETKGEIASAIAAAAIKKRRNPG